jgi:hypothetical protein
MVKSSNGLLSGGIPGGQLSRWLTVFPPIFVVLHPPARPLPLIFLKSLLQFLHLVHFWISCKFDSHFERSDLLLPEKVHPYWDSGKGAIFDVWRVIDGYLQNGVAGVAGGIEKVEAIVKDLGHEQAGAVAGNVYNAAGKGAGDKLAAIFVHRMHFDGQVVDNTFGFSLFNAHEGPVC